MLRAALLVLALAAAGCTSTPNAILVAPKVEFGAMALETVPLEPFEARGILAVAWQDGLFAVSTQREGGMPARAVVDGDTIYTSETGLGWIRQDLDGYTREHGRGFRYLAWDARALVETGDVVTVTPGQFQVAARFQAAGMPGTATVTVDHEGGRATQVRIETDADPESPYTLRPLVDAFAFAVQVPTPARTPEDVAANEPPARDNHAQVLQWIDQYRSQLGRLPQEPTADALAVQRLGTAWPNSPYDGQPLGNQHASGHFVWKRCSDTDASYQGLGWDVAPLSRTFGRGCT